MVVAVPCFEKIALGFYTDGIHEWKRVFGAVDFAVSQLPNQAVRHKLNIVAHGVGVDTNQRRRDRFDDEFFFNVHGVPENVLDDRFVDAIGDFAVQQTGKVAVHALVARDEFVCSDETGHQPASVFQPKDGTKAAAKKDTLDNGKCNESFGKLVVAANPLERPVFFFF